ILQPPTVERHCARRGYGRGLQDADHENGPAGRPTGPSGWCEWFVTRIDTGDPPPSDVWVAWTARPVARRVSRGPSAAAGAARRIFYRSELTRWATGTLLP